MLQQRVEAGMAWLNETYPGWRTRIVLEDLDLGLCGQCILGQLFSHYVTAVERYGLSEDDVILLGFDHEYGKYEELTTIWRNMLELATEEMETEKKCSVGNTRPPNASGQLAFLI